jgi:hypothetical protein
METKFKIFFINFGYYSQEDFSDLESAISYGKSKGFEFSVWEFFNDATGLMCASWSVFGGTRYVRA